MTVTQTNLGYCIVLDAGERDQLIVALEFATGSARRDHGNALRGLLRDLDADRLDALADRLFLAEPLA